MWLVVVEPSKTRELARFKQHSLRDAFERPTFTKTVRPAQGEEIRQVTHLTQPEEACDWKTESKKKTAAAAAAQYVLKLKHDSIWRETCITISHVVGRSSVTHLHLTLRFRFRVRFGDKDENPPAGQAARFFLCCATPLPSIGADQPGRTEYRKVAYLHSTM